MAEEKTHLILIVDDEVQARKLISLVLKRQGYNVSEAGNGIEAVDVALANPPDLILLDMMMPGKDGLQVTRELRENPVTSDIPIVMFTARGMVDDKVEGFEAGVDDYLTKPVHPAELTARVAAILSSRSASE